MKTHVNELDHRSTPLRILCTASTNAIAELIAFSQHPALLDNITAREYAEYFHGAVLVACQAYAVGTVGDINKIRSASGLAAVTKLALYKFGVVQGAAYTRVELVNALANLFKHQDEWTTWPANETTRTLRHFGIDDNTEFPLGHGVACLIGDTADLRGVCEILEMWRCRQIQYWCEENP